jgi:hypothetical protein
MNTAARYSCVLAKAMRESILTKRYDQVNSSPYMTGNMSYASSMYTYPSYATSMADRTVKSTATTNGGMKGLAYYDSRSPLYPDSYEEKYYSEAHHGHYEYPNYEDFANSNTSPSYPHHADSPGYIETEQRKILITHLERKANHEDVIAWIRKRLGSAASHVSGIDVPRQDGSGQLRGHGYVTFRTASAARKGVEALDQKKFQKHHVSARLTVEGVAVAQPPKSSHKTSSKSASKTSSKKENRESGPVIAHGSSRKAPIEKRR